MTTLALVANAGDGTISTFEVGADALRRMAVSPAGPGVGTFAVDPERMLVFAGVKGEPDPAVVTLGLDPSTGQLSELSRITVSASMTYLDLTPDRTRLLGASYGGGVAVGWTVGGDGSLGEPGASVTHPNLHCVVAADDQTAYLVSLGADLVSHCEVGADGGLTEIGTTPAPPGSGPRHLVLSGTGSAAYVVTEFSGEVLSFRRDSHGVLTQTGSVSVVDSAAGLAHSRIGADPRVEHLIWGADVHLRGDGLWATERTASTIASVAIRDQVAAEVTHLRATEPQPRGFGITPDGSHVLVTGELSTTVTLYRIQADTSLEQVAQAETGRGANWVRFLQVAEH